MRQLLLVLMVAWLAPAAAAQSCASAALPAILEELDAGRMKAAVEKLAAFGTRHTLSDTTSETRGIGAARRWIFAEMTRAAEASNGRMTVAYHKSTHQGRRTKDQPVEIVNVLATIRGTRDPDRIYIASAHYDSINSDSMDAAGDAPGANDDASGTAVVMELARVLTRRPLDATVILAAVAGEEQLLFGAKGLADTATAEKWNVEGMITNDIVGNIEGTNGIVDTQTIRIFSANTRGAGDSTSRHWARYVRENVRRFLPAVRPRLVYRLDRFRRSGDHVPFFQAGFPAIRFSEPHENSRRQHQNVRVENGVHYGDVPEHVSAPYLKLVASVNAVALAGAACAPAAPQNVRVKGRVSSDTTLTWDAATEEDLAGYEILVRETTSDEWETVIPIGRVTSHTLKDVSIDNVFIGVRAVDRDGNRSPVRTPEERGAPGSAGVSPASEKAKQQ